MLHKIKTTTVCLNERELLSKLFKNLVQRSQHPRCIDKATFCRVFPLPGVLGERLFKVFDTDNTSLITHDQFFDGVAIVLKGSIEDKIKFLFRIMDLDEQEKISKTDLETVLNCIVSAQQSWLNEADHSSLLTSPTTPWLINNKPQNKTVNDNNSITRTRAVIDCQNVVAELLEDAFLHTPQNTEYLTLRIFAGWIIEHPYLWQIIEDTFKLNSTYNTSLTPGLRRRRSESLSSMASDIQILHAPTHHHHHHNHNHHYSISDRPITPKSIQTHEFNPEHLLIDNVLEPKESFSNQLQLQKVSSYKSIKQAIEEKEAIPSDEDDQKNTTQITTTTQLKIDNINTSNFPLTRTIRNNSEICNGSQLLNNGNSNGLIRTKSQYSKNLFQFKFDSTPLVPDMFGYLTKIGRRLQLPIKRWYLLHANFLYVFKNHLNTKPRHVILLQGCQIKTFSKHDDENKKYGIELVIGINTIRHQTKILFASTEKEQYRWINALKQSADAFVIEDFFNIHEKLGSGKFSTVYRATDKKNKNNQYAVKIIQRRSLSPRENKALRTEIAVLRMLNHPNIISIQHVFETIENICLVMDYVRGGDLFDRIVEMKRFPESTAKLVLYKLLKVILYLHKRGIVHRDLKPENILCLHKHKIDEILVIDFGLSSFFTPKELLKSPCGTLSYVAPEVLKGYGYGKEVDLWSAGVILYVMLRGKLPFDSNNRNNKNDKTNLIRKVISGRFSMRNDCWKLRSNQCKDLIIRLLCVDPQKRLTAQNALMHPWFNTINHRLSCVDDDVNILSLKSVPESQNENAETENECDDKKEDVVLNRTKSL